MKTMTTMLAIALVLPGVAHAQSLAFDFDTDQDPTTVESEITASVGEIVEAYLVVNDVPDGYGYLHGLQYGLALTGGLELVGIGLVPTVDGGLAGGMGLYDPDGDGPEGVLVTLDTPVDTETLPSFAMRFTVRVIADGAQTVSIVPSTGWGFPYDGFVYLVSTSGSLTQADEIVDAGAIDSQRVGTIAADPTPIETVSWSGMKAHF
jgi:hypothetical protein